MLHVLERGLGITLPRWLRRSRRTPRAPCSRRCWLRSRAWSAMPRERNCWPSTRSGGCVAPVNQRGSRARHAAVSARLVRKVCGQILPQAVIEAAVRITVHQGVRVVLADSTEDTLHRIQVTCRRGRRPRTCIWPRAFRRRPYASPARAATGCARLSQARRGSLPAKLGGGRATARGSARSRTRGEVRPARPSFALSLVRSKSVQGTASQEGRGWFAC